MKNRRALGCRLPGLILVLLWALPAVAGESQGGTARRARVLQMPDLAGTKPQIQKLGEQQLRSLEREMRHRLEGRYDRVALLSLAYTYRGVSDLELRQGVDFYATEAGRRPNRVGNRSLIGARGEAAREVGKGLGRILREKKGVKV